MKTKKTMRRTRMKRKSSRQLPSRLRRNLTRSLMRRKRMRRKMRNSRPLRLRRTRMTMTIMRTTRSMTWTTKLFFVHLYSLEHF